jgi:hypothetical protein
MEEKIEKCSTCDRHYRADLGSCHHCDKHERMVKNGLRWRRLAPLPSSNLRKPWTPLAMIGDLKLSHSGRGYWIVSGRVPLATAILLYGDPVGRDLIRVDGHCGCPSPETPWVKWFKDDKQVLPIIEQEDANKIIAQSKSEMMVNIGRKILAENLFSDDPSSIGASGFVTTYHIDGDLGLRVFVDVVTPN